MVHVFVVSPDYGYEGLAEPRAVFTTEEAAQKAVKMFGDLQQWNISAVEVLVLGETADALIGGYQE